MTSSRYWMFGLVSAGAVMALDTVARWLCGRVAAWRKKDFTPSTWWQVWVGCVTPLGSGIPTITMTVNSPTLPPALATACTVATLVGLAVALLPGRGAAERPLDLLWLVGDGIGLMPAPLILRVLELPSQGLSISVPGGWLFVIGGLLAGSGWLAGTSILRIWRQSSAPCRRGRAGPELRLGAAGPLPAGAPPRAYRYISTAGS